MQEKAVDAEKEVENGRSKELYSISKMQDKQCVLRTKLKDRMERWKEHFSEILNRQDPIDPITEDDIEHIDGLEDIDTGR